jgi:hypothetical protein
MIFISHLYGSRDKRCLFRTCDITSSVMLTGWSAERMRIRSCIEPLRLSIADDVIRSAEMEFNCSRSAVLKSKSSPSDIFANRLYPPATRSTLIVWNMRCCRSVHKHAITLRTRTRSSGSTLASISMGISFIRSASKTSRREAMRLHTNITTINNTTPSILRYATPPRKRLTALLLQHK